MYVFVVLLILFIIAVTYGMIEYFLHQKRIYSIPIRIHVNGTRGKSSVTRLIGSALSEAGIKTITKVTGTYPRLILDDGSEAEIYRKTDANIIEQLSVVKLAAEKKVRAVVLECMALQPQFQEITETKMIHATIGVITNVRLDHIDIMGYSLPEITDTLSKTIPAKRHLFTAEKEMYPLLKAEADKKKSVIHSVDSETVTQEEMNGFSYMEHKENVALALSVCKHLGIKREIALKGMYKAIPDAGVLSFHPIISSGKRINFYNAFAANDPQSTLMILNWLKNENRFTGTKIILLNSRQDRIDRAKQLSEMIGKYFGEDIDYLILIGQPTDMVENLSVSNGVRRNKILNLGLTDPVNVFNAVLSCTDNESSVFAIGNMGGMGAAVAELFGQRSMVDD
jgi:poly-gamma-glutamate synthase PgsB/CapB